VASQARAPDAIIVIFGAAVRPDGAPSTTLRRRVEAASAFRARHAAPLFIPTGGVGRYGASEASVMADLLGALALPNATIVLEETGTDTLSSVRAVARIIRERGLSAPVYAATSRYHLPRCVLLLRMAGVRARACPPPAFPAAERLSRRWYWRLREVLALPFDLLLMAAIRLRGRA
jgi:uncharacterized SAM-binding protein YcdF (DUF218 family)